MTCTFKPALAMLYPSNSPTVLLVLTHVLQASVMDVKAVDISFPMSLLDPQPGSTSAGGRSLQAAKSSSTAARGTGGSSNSSGANGKDCLLVVEVLADTSTQGHKCKVMGIIVGQSLAMDLRKTTNALHDNFGHLEGQE